MKQLISDLKQLILKHWKTLSVIATVLFIVYAYPDIKQGISDGWAGK